MNWTEQQKNVFNICTEWRLDKFYGPFGDFTRRSNVSYSR